AVAAVTLWGGRLPSRASKKAAPQANLVPGAAKANGLRFPDGRESYWEAQPVEGNPDLLYFRNVGILTRKATFLAMRENIEVLKRALTLPPEQAGFLLDENPDLETLADSACDGIRQKPERFPPIPLVSVLQEIAGGSEGAMEELRSEKTGPLGATLIGSRLSTVRFPPLDGRIEIASIVLRCGEMSGQRLNQAQRRGTLFHLMQARDALGARLLRHEHQMVQNTTDKGSRESIKAMRLTVQFKAVGSLLRQNEAYARELASDAQAEALTGVTAGFSSLLKSDLTEVARAYEKGRFVFPIFYPPLKPEAVLAEADLLFLSAY
ncbi:MAG: hypothetical protein NDJ90_10940, partial [Oligoflexia bacterium]|nr:hypothetical protein [Oligoflexia bacterium]